MPVIAHRMVIDPQARFSGVTAAGHRRGDPQDPAGARLDAAGARACGGSSIRAFRRHLGGRSTGSSRRFTAAGPARAGEHRRRRRWSASTPTAPSPIRPSRFLVALLAVALVASLTFRGRFGVRRVMPRFGTAGEPLAYRVLVRQRRTTPVARARAPGGHSPIRALRSSRVPRRARARRGAPQLVRPHGRLSALDVAHRAASGRPGRASARCRRSCPAWRREVRVEIVPARRGRLRLIGVTIARPDPFGLFRGFVARVRAPVGARAAAALPGARSRPAREAEVPARRRCAGRVGGRLRGVRLAPRLPAGRSAAPHPLAELGADRHVPS